jgi:hypothetical protein
MIGLIMGWTGLGGRASIILAIAAGLLLAGGGVKLWLWLHDQAVIERHEEKITAKVAKKTLDAERRADREDRKVEARNRARAEEIQERIEDAILEQPEAVAQPVGPAVAAVLDELRRQGAGEDRSAVGGAD